MSEHDAVSSHTFGDPDEALEHFTPERMADAEPRVIHLDEQGRRIEAPSAPPAPSEDESPCS